VITDVAFFTVPAKSVPKLPRPLELQNLTFQSSRWIYQPPPHLRHSGYRRADRISIVYPNLGYFTSNNPRDRILGDVNIESLRKSARVNWPIGDNISFSLIIKDANWPLKVQGEEVWYQRLHKGMTRRSLIQAKQNMAKSIAQQLGRIILEWQSIVSTVHLIFGDGRYGRDFDNNQDFNQIVELIQKMLSGVVTRIEIARYLPQRN